MTDYFQNPDFQVELRAKLERLRDSLTDRYCRWGDWERNFINNITIRLNGTPIQMTNKEYVKVYDLWERSLK